MRRFTDILAGADDPRTIIRRLREAVYTPWLAPYAEREATRMVNAIWRYTSLGWRQAAAQHGRGRVIHGALAGELEGPLSLTYHLAIQRNAQFIQSIPADVAREFTEHIASQAVAGLRPQVIAQQLRDLYPHVTDVKASLIARTETSKTHTAIERSRSEGLGVHWYRWRTSEDQRVRESHRAMDDVLVAWNDPPSPEELVGEPSVGPYHCGDIWNCRCVPIGILLLSDVQWPAKVYTGGVISRMTQSEFRRIWVPSHVA